jgi:hypothetical protein
MPESASNSQELTVMVGRIMGGDACVTSCGLSSRWQLRNSQDSEGIELQRVTYLC